MKGSLIKVLTIILFVCLITTFVCYRSGVFEKKEENKVISQDTSQFQVKTTDIISSTKSIILTDDLIKNIPKRDSIIPDSTKINYKTPEVKSPKLRKIPDSLISSSKSSLIVSPKDIERIQRELDSVSKDTTNHD